MDDSPQTEWQTWRDKRHKELASPDGWLTLVGLHWLDEGEHQLGSATDCDPQLAVGPAHWGTLRVEGEKAFWTRADGVQRELRTDAQDQPDEVRAGSASFILIERDGRIALRLRDSESSTRRDFTGVETFPYDPAWRMEVEWDATPQELQVATMTGGLETRRVPGRAVLTLNGEQRTVTPLDQDEQGLFFVFADQTSGKGGTYGGGRFLRASLPQDGKLILDFNRAYNPPCAFTPYATCPLAPPENRLPVAVTAGEKTPAGH
jgi:uncharacterized protein (DUF1684 family)